jgi:hypothetical protein
MAACGGTDAPDTADLAGDTAEVTAQTATPPAGDAGQIACVPTASGDELTGRASPYDSVTVQVAGQSALVCYSRPSMRGRQVYGGLVPYDTLWRTGANEPTIIHLPVAATIAGVAVEPGSYSIYTVPGQQQWTVIVNRSTSQWGHEDSYTPEVRAEEVGRGPAASEAIDSPVEQFTIRAEPAGQGSNLILEWENTRVTIPVMPGA